MKKIFLSLALLMGCIEYQPTSTLPPAGAPNPKPLTVTEQTDKLVQVTEPEVDILWVIDNSCSMYEEQTGLATNFPVFMDYFLGSGLNYHIGVVSTDMTNGAHTGRLREVSGHRFIDEDTPSPSQVFSSMAVMGTGGSADERGRDAAYMGLEILKDGYNSGFVREDATLHVVAISDENDHSYQISLQEYINWMLTLKYGEDMVTFSSIVSPSPVCAGAAEPGTDYTAITNAVGGINWSICNDDWATVLEQLGLQAAGLKREYFLSQLPVPGTIDVAVSDGGTVYSFEEEIDWVYNQVRNSIIFNEYIPGALAEVHVTYDLLSETEQ